MIDQTENMINDKLTSGQLISSADHWWGWLCCYCFFYCTYWTPDLPGALMEWPTLNDQPVGCTKGLHEWHQKSETALSGASLWSAYISCRRPPITAVTLATRVRLTCLGSTISTRVPTLTEGFMLSVSWVEHVKMVAWEKSRSHYPSKTNRMPVYLYLYVEVNRESVGPHQLWHQICFPVWDVLLHICVRTV